MTAKRALITGVTGQTLSVREFVEATFGLLGLDWQDFVKSAPY